MAPTRSKAGRPKADLSGRTLDAFPDRIDLRDWPYQPSLAGLPDTLINCSTVPLVLDQGTEGACTGFALAAVGNFLLARRGVKRSLSPRMLYEMARCYDEWPGEAYEGSSARGAMKGWSRHGVCERTAWKDSMRGRSHLDAKIARAALENPCGAYYRVNHREVRDVHAALAEVGIVYCTLMVHDGWDQPGGVTVEVRDGRAARSLPVIARKGRAASGHAVALVGYTRDGFVVQNSWGAKWGAKGFALLPYEDFLMHATDLWVAQIGVPLSVDLWARTEAADSTSGRTRTSRHIPLAEVRPYIVDVGNNGELSESGDYWTSEEDLARLFTETVPAAAKAHGWDRRRVMLYLHGGLNDEKAAAKRAVAFRDVCLANGVYPLHVMWETGPLETIASMLGDVFTDADERAGGGLMEGMRNAKDFALELTASPIGGPMWAEMKENAWRASDHRKGRGAMQLMQKHAMASLAQVAAAERRRWELHVVAHSAGSIMLAHALPHLCSLGIAFRSLQLFAPAIRIDDFREHALSHIAAGRCPKPTVYVLGEQQELDDTVGPYGRSLLWLVANAFEDRRATPLLGMRHFLRGEAALCRQAFAEVVEASPPGTAGAACTASTHGGFDNDAASMNSVLARILGHAPKVPFTARDLDY